MDHSLHISVTQLAVLYSFIAIMMLGVSLDLKAKDFIDIAKNPKAPLAGLFCQFLLLPLSTSLITWWLNLDAQIALGMILVSACPGGSFSNIFTWLAKGNTAISISMTAISSLAAPLLTPLNFAFYSWLNPNTRELFSLFTLNPLEVLVFLFFVLALPIGLGFLLQHRWASVTKHLHFPIKLLSIIGLGVLIGIAIQRNFQIIIQNIPLFFAYVVGHNAIALLLGFLSASFIHASAYDRRAMTLEIGIQNSSIAIGVAIAFFPENEKMLIIAAFWGVWHLVSGGLLSLLWSTIPLPSSTSKQQYMHMHSTEATASQLSQNSSAQSHSQRF